MRIKLIAAPGLLVLALLGVINTKIAMAEETKGAGSPNQLIQKLLSAFKNPDWSMLQVKQPAENQITLAYHAKKYPIDQKLRGIYPAGIQSVDGPSDDGFIVHVSIAPSNSLPMMRTAGGRYIDKSVDQPYWKQRTYGFERGTHCVVVGVDEGKKASKKLLGRVEQDVVALVELRSSE